jgi:hypothetical protein
MIQSNYLPWRGYFDFIDDVDLFIFYDDVQYTHKDWRNRNRIKTHAGPLWLSVPVFHDRTTLIENARINYGDRWVAKHIKSISLAYQKAPYFSRYAADLFAILEQKLPTISQLNVELCRWIMGELGIKTRIDFSSRIGHCGKSKHDRPLSILRELGASSYLSGPAARPYTDTARYEAAGIALEFKSYDYPDYPQLHGPFDGQVSAVDLLFNCGPQSRDFLKSKTPNEHACGEPVPARP